MKARILSLAFALIALFAFNDAFAQKDKTGSGNPHYVEGPCLTSSNVVIGKIAGLGTGPFIAVITGQSYCQNPGASEKIPPAWDNFEVEEPLRQERGGNYILSVQLGRECNRNWSFGTRNLFITIKDSEGNVRLGPTAIDPC
jgi:hypothetical protein